MGLIKALTNSVSTAIGDQFKEYVTCPTVDNQMLIVRGKVQHGQGNTNPSEDIISNGSKIVIPQGWAMMLVDNGKVEFSSEAGEYIYDNSSEPSIFYGGLGKGILDTFKTIGSRFTFGGQTARNQRVFYINLLNVMGNKFGSTSPKDIYDETYQMSIKMTFYGQFAYQVVDPILLVANVVGANLKDSYTFDEVFNGQFKGEVNEQMHKALSNVMASEKIRYSQIGNYTEQIANQLNAILSEKWGKYGVAITEVSMENISTTDEYTKIIRDIESKSVETRMVGQAYSENMAGTMAAATAEAMKNAAGNSNGAMMGFAGLNFAQNAGNSVMNTVAGMTSSNPVQEQVPIANQVPSEPAPVQEVPQQPVQEAVTPAETTPQPEATGTIPNFCPNCGAKTNGMNFCANCGNKLI